MTIFSHFSAKPDFSQKIKNRQFSYFIMLIHNIHYRKDPMTQFRELLDTHRPGIPLRTLSGSDSPKGENSVYQGLRHEKVVLSKSVEKLYMF